MGTDHCVECSRKVTTKQHALQCDECSSWQHRLCNTGITQTEYRKMVKEKTLSFICNKCKESKEETISGPADSTHITEQPTLEHGNFSMSMISSVDLNISRDPKSPTPPAQPPTTPHSASVLPFDRTTIIQQSSPQPSSSVTDGNLTASFDLTRRLNGDPLEIQEDGPIDSTHITDQPTPEHGNFNMSMISSVDLNSTYTIHRDPGSPTPPPLPPTPPHSVSVLPFDRTTIIQQSSPQTSSSVTDGNLTASFDLTRRLNGDPSEIQEESIQEPALPDTIPDVPVTYTVVDSGSQRGQRLLVSSDGYQYTKKTSKGAFTYWRCAKRSTKVNCPATVSQKGDRFKTNARQHIHQAHKGALKKVIVTKEVKAQGRQDIHKPGRRVVEDCMLEHIEPDDHQLPNVKNLTRLCNRVREEMRPKEPTDLNFILDTEYLQCQDFLIGDVRVDDERHLVFATPTQLQILQQAKRWFCDGTFKVVADPFEQMWSIHAFIRKGDSIKQIPLVFCLMSRRKTRDYLPIFQLLKQKVDGLCSVEGFVADFEKGAWKAIRQEFPNATIKGCAFHFGQAVFRKVTDLGLKTTYSLRGPIYRYIRSLMALPFLPSVQIEPAFDTLSTRATSPELQRLVNYIENTWIANSVFQPRNWNVFQHSIRTNNDVEGWHTRINKNIGKTNLSFYITERSEICGADRPSGFRTPDTTGPTKPIRRP